MPNIQAMIRYPYGNRRRRRPVHSPRRPLPRPRLRLALPGPHRREARPHRRRTPGASRGGTRPPAPRRHDPPGPSPSPALHRRRAAPGTPHPGGRHRGRPRPGALQEGRDRPLPHRRQTGRPPPDLTAPGLRAAPRPTAVTPCGRLAAAASRCLESRPRSRGLRPAGSRCRPSSLSPRERRRFTNEGSLPLPPYATSTPLRASHHRRRRNSRRAPIPALGSSRPPPLIPPGSPHRARSARASRATPSAPRVGCSPSPRAAG